MTKIVKVGHSWTISEVESFVDELEEANIDALVVMGDEIEVFDGELENITIEGEEILEEERFSGDSLFGVKQ